MPDRRVYRYQIPASGKPVSFELTAMCPPIAVGTDRGEWVVDFWCEHVRGASTVTRRFQVFATGASLPAGARHVGTAPRTAHGLVWHLYDVTDVKDGEV